MNDWWMIDWWMIDEWLNECVNECWINVEWMKAK
jgi:hypothetical protein